MIWWRGEGSRSKFEEGVGGCDSYLPCSPLLVAAAPAHGSICCDYLPEKVDAAILSFPRSSRGEARCDTERCVQR